VKWKTELV